MAVLVLLALCGPCLRARSDPPADEAEDEAEEDLRERLTERPDKRRPEHSWTTPIADRPLTISGEYALEPQLIRRRVLVDPDADQHDRALWETSLEVEAFYSFGSVLSLFGQFDLRYERDLLGGMDAEDEVSDLFLEPVEIWALSEDVAGTDIDLDVGRLHFEDERRWWWDDEIESARLAYDADDLEASLSVARRLLPERFDRSWVEPSEERVLRIMGHASWDFRPNHTLALFALHADDHSPTESVGSIVRTEREDESDGRLRWLGGRATGVFDLRPPVTLGYWLDLAWVRGNEQRIDYEDRLPGLPGRSEVESVEHRHVHGGAYDAGASVTFASVAGEPRFFGGNARASRDFRQNGLQGNAAGFGGAERFASYGVLLDPEFSNLDVVTAGAGLSLLRSSSLDLVWHAYRLRSRSAESVPDVSLVVHDLEPRHADLGQEIDLVFALEEWERLEFEIALAAFRTGGAFEPSDRGETSLGALFAVRVSF